MTEKVAKLYVGERRPSRRDASEIPTLVEEEHNDEPKIAIPKTETRKYSDSNLPPAYSKAQLKATKASRRSSLGLSLGLLGGKSDSQKAGKRRSSIAVVLLGRRNSKVWKFYYLLYNFAVL